MGASKNRKSALENIDLKKQISTNKKTNKMRNNLQQPHQN